MLKVYIVITRATTRKKKLKSYSYKDFRSVKMELKRFFFFWLICNSEHRKEGRINKIKILKDGTNRKYQHDIF